MRYRKIFIVTLLLVAVVCCFVTCSQQPSGNDPRGTLYAGSKACMQCHKDIVDDYVHTGHFKTSSPVLYDSIKKALMGTKTIADFPNGHTVKVEDAGNSIKQTETDGNNVIESEKLEVAFGSGEKAQTFGYWKNNQLFELPLTYLSQMQLWTNSPGFPEEYPYFARAIVSRCFECHATYVYHRTENPKGLELREILNANTIVYGIDCERCHGPAKEHVDFHLANPDEKKAHFIVSISSLSRSQQTDLCATCHSGNHPPILRSIFAFTPGDSLKRYYIYNPGSYASPDVHGMQLQSLMQSACYQKSTTLTCITCHNSHVSEKNKEQETLITQCFSCHQQSKHSSQMRVEQKNCITCHMPLQASKSLDFNNSSGTHSILYKLRTHHIAIYPKTEWQ